MGRTNLHRFIGHLIALPGSEESRKNEPEKGSCRSSSRGIGLSRIRGWHIAHSYLKAKVSANEEQMGSMVRAKWNLHVWMADCGSVDGECGGGEGSGLF
jgi:hypothetical protein